MVMRQQDVFDRLVGDFGDAIDHLARHHRRGLGIDDHDAIVADDDPGIGVALGGKGVQVGADGVEGNRLVGEIRSGGELRAHRVFLPGTCSIN